MPFYEQDWTFLWDFNIEIQAKMLELLDLQVDIQLTKEYKVDFDENVLDARNSIHPKKETDTGSLKNYYQVFEQRFGFIPNLSIIDLLFNMGNESILVLI